MHKYSVDSAFGPQSFGGRNIKIHPAINNLHKQNSSVPKSIEWVIKYVAWVCCFTCFLRRRRFLRFTGSLGQCFCCRRGKDVIYTMQKKNNKTNNMAWSKQSSIFWKSTYKISNNTSYAHLPMSSSKIDLVSPFDLDLCFGCVVSVRSAKISKFSSNKLTSTAGCCFFWTLGNAAASSWEVKT